MVARLGVAAKFEFRVHPHMLRHATGFQLANKGVDTRSIQAYLGHRNIQHTVRYTELRADAVQRVLGRLDQRPRPSTEPKAEGGAPRASVLCRLSSAWGGKFLTQSREHRAPSPEQQIT